MRQTSYLRASLAFFALAVVFALGFVNTVNAQQNLALDSQATASASSTYNANFPASAAIDGDHKGYCWGCGGGWNDQTRGVFPDVLTVTTARPSTAPYSFGKFIVTTLQDDFSNPVEPTPTQTCTLYGVKDFDIEVLNPSGSWVQVASITGNTLCKREVSITPTRGTAYRIIVNGSWDGLYSRVIEFPAFVSSS